MPTDGRGEVGWDEGVDVGREVDSETQRDFEEYREIEVCRGVMDLGEEGERDGVNLAMPRGRGGNSGVKRWSAGFEEMIFVVADLNSRVSGRLRFVI